MVKYIPTREQFLKKAEKLIKEFGITGEGSIAYILDAFNEIGWVDELYRVEEG